MFGRMLDQNLAQHPLVALCAAGIRVERMRSCLMVQGAGLLVQCSVSCVYCVWSVLAMRFIVSGRVPGLWVKAEPISVWPGWREDQV